eukprot:3720938-Amphidinium_carterae.1
MCSLHCIGKVLECNTYCCAWSFLSLCTSEIWMLQEASACNCADTLHGFVEEQLKQRQMVKFSQSTPSIIPAASGSISPRLPEPKGGRDYDKERPSKPSS